MTEVLAPFLVLSNLSALAALLAYGGLGVYFAQRLAVGGQPLTRVAVTFLLALACSATWAGAVLLEGVSHWSARPPSWIAPAFDLLRTACWYAFMLMLLPPPRRGGAFGLLRPLAAGVLLLSAGLVFWSDGLPAGALARPQGFAALAAAVLGLVLVEQMLRNATGDARWNAKPVCLGLGAIFVFDLFVGSQAALFERFDGEAGRHIPRDSRRVPVAAFVPCLRLDYLEACLREGLAPVPRRHLTTILENRATVMRES